jgi:competence protein CoiA
MRTEHGLIIEFQHSHLDPQERVARERFYGNMVWVLDGTRLTRDYSRFLEGKIDFRPTFLKGFFLKAHPEECFPAAWMESSVPVLFDFRGTAPTEPSDVTRELLWCLLPGRAEGYAVVAAISRSDFVQVVSSRANLLPVPAHELVSTVALQIQQQRANAAAIETGRALTG